MKHRKIILKLAYMVTPLFKPAEWYAAELETMGYETSAAELAAPLEYLAGKGLLEKHHGIDNRPIYAISAAGVDAWERGEL